ncbi:putative vacuolar amino acid transporter YPQ3 [Erysiphe neolycopersici]|uniref:Putative vacuolar amino acid transporter YPQ3 n=1 Tax=Erysiphe neolycopersici TaxID=212602 RepID=A0A420HNK5_9PEZI|nr:putative vacuolar amino acid transporter YPQ3 [Erysiphe neolycopersici]
MSLLRKSLELSITDISGICGSISIACWLFVFLPQLIENFRRRSTEGLSVRFVSIWLSGDVCNVLGSILQGVLPTMIILAIYYATVDILLLSQIFYYRGFTWSEERISNGPNESSRLLNADNLVAVEEQGADAAHLSAAHLSPAVPFVRNTDDIIIPHAATHNTFRKFVAIVLIIFIGVLGWFLTRSSALKNTPASPVIFNPWGQTFGYICAVLYLSSRLPQLLLNYRRKSTEGISLLFFVFACIANLTYVLSILIYEPSCEAQKGTRDQCKPGELQKNYWRHIAVNTSWIIGSAGTCFLDFLIFIFSLYKNYVQS